MFCLNSFSSVFQNGQGVNIQTEIKNTMGSVQGWRAAVYSKTLLCSLKLNWCNAAKLKQNGAFTGNGVDVMVVISVELH